MYDFDTFLALAILQRNVSATQARATFFFHSRRLCWHENELPALEVSRKSILSFPPSLPFTFFCCSRPRCRSQFCFFNPSNGIFFVLLELTLSVMFGDLEFRMWQIRRVYFARGVKKTLADFAIFKNQWNSLHKCIRFGNRVISLEVFRKSELAFPPSAPCTFFCRRRPAWECDFCVC